MTDPVDPSIAGSSGPPDVTLEERTASRSKGPDRTGVEPTTHPAPPKGSTNEPAGRGPPAPTAAPPARTPRVELPHSEQTMAAALVATMAVTQSTPTATVPQRAASRSRSPPRSPPPTAVRGSTAPPPPCVAAPSPPAPPAYLAAGVLPFCVLGGDLLFLLGQQLRFRSRVRGRSFPEMGGGSTTPVAAEDEGRVASAAARQLPPSIETTPLPSGAPPPPPPPAPVWRPRRGPRPKVSLSLSPGSSGSASSGQPPGDASPSPPAVAGARAAAGAQASRETAAKVEEAAPSASFPVAGASRDGTEHDMQKGACGARVGGGAPMGGGELGMAGKRSEMAALAVQENDLEAAMDSPSGAGDPSAPHGTAVKNGQRSGGINPEDGSSNTAVLPEEDPPAAATGDPHPPVEETAAAPEQEIVPAGLLWSDFGGAREASDADAEETASREFAEESFGIFHGVRLESDSVARSQATMSSALRDPSLRGKRVFECRNGGYVMYVAEVDFVPDLMINLARKEIVGEDGSGPDAVGVQGEWGGSGQGQASSPGFSEKTDFAWVPASVLLRAMRESRNRSTRKVVVKLGGCRYLRLFHKFVISLWGLDLAAVIQAASTPLQGRRASLPRPRTLLVESNAEPISRCDSNQDETGGESSDGATSSERCAAIRGIDCVRPSFLSGRKRTSLGIIDGRRDRRWDGGGGGARGAAGSEDGEAGSDSGDVNGGGDDAGDGLRSGRSRKSGAACRKRRRQCKQARRLKAAAKAEAAEAARVPSTAVPPEA
ncbi:unnamed protein product [Ectocarpus sp. 8 AP-2014]